MIKEHLETQGDFSPNHRRSLTLLALSAILFVLLGLLTFLLAQTGLLFFSRESAKRFEAYTQTITNQSGEKLAATTAAIYPLKGLFLETPSPSQSQFEKFIAQTQLFTLNPSLLAVGYLHRLGDAPLEGGKGLEISLFESPSVSKLIYANSLNLEDKTTLDLIINAAMTGNPVTRTNVEIPGMQESYGFSLYLPVYDETTGTTTNSARLGKFKGVLVGYFSYDKLFENCIGTEGVSLEIWANGERMTRDSCDLKCQEIDCSLLKQKYPLMLERSLYVSNQEIKLSFVGSRYFGLLPQAGSLVLVLLVLGILANFLIVSVIFLLANGRNRARTLALQLTRTIRDSERKYLAMFEVFSDIFFETDKEGKITTITPSVFKLLGLKPQDLVGKPLDSLITDKTAREAMLSQLHEKGALDDWELDLTSATGKKMTFAVDAQVLHEHDNFIGITYTLYDITARKLKRDALEGQKQELERVNRILLEREIKMAELKEENRRLREESHAH